MAFFINRSDHGDGMAALSRAVEHWLPPARMLLLLAVISVVEFVSHLHINGEIVAFGPYELLWSSANGVVKMVNVAFVHFEGINNLRNTHFFAGGDAPIDLSYTVPTGRLLAPFLAAVANLATGDILVSTYAVNLLIWVLAAWAAWDIGRRDIGDPLIGLVLGVFVATNQGFVTNVLDTKSHLAGWGYLMLAVFIAERLRLFNRKTPWLNYLAMGWVAGLGIFMNGAYGMILGYVLLRGILTAQWRNLAIMIAVPVVLSVLVKFTYAQATARGMPVGNMESVLLANLIVHIKAAWAHLIHGAPVAFSISSGSGSFSYSGILEPFHWMARDLRSLVLMPGIPVAVLALMGLAMPDRRAMRIALPLLVSVIPFVALILTYWPWPAFLGYLFYFATFAFLILAAAGVRNLLSLAMRFGLPAPVGGILLTALISGQVVYTNQDILFGRLIEHVRLHRNFDVPYPAGWDFNMLAW